MLKIVSFNINGIRARPHQLEAIKARHDPDILGIQECKVADEEFPRAVVETLGLVPEYFGQKGHYGVALLSRSPPLAVTRGLPADPPHLPHSAPARPRRACAQTGRGSTRPPRVRSSSGCEQ